MQIFLIIFIVLLSVVLGVSFYLVCQVIYPRFWSEEDTIKRETELGRFDQDRFNALPRQEVWIPSPYGYKLHGIYIPAENSHKLVVLSHGYAYNLYGQVKYIQLFRSRGYHVLLYDHRAHGRSGGIGTTFGYYEKYDLKAVVDWVYQKLGSGTIVGTMGESYGAGIVLQHGAVDPRLTFIIADSSWSSLPDLLCYHLKKDYHLPKIPFYPIVNFLAAMLTGMSFETNMPMLDVRDTITPIYFIHGKNDSFIPYEMSQKMYEAKTRGIRKLYIVEDAKHAEAYSSHPGEYDRRLGEFLDSIEG